MFFEAVLALIGLVALGGGCVVGYLLVRERFDASPVEVLDERDPNLEAMSAVERMHAEMFTAAQALRDTERSERT